MNICGIICEYNPFHYGHKYQLELVKKQFDAVVCVMSGSFVQRGELAVFDKWTRCEAALSYGADLVLELPVKNVLSSAEGFATGGVLLLEALGTVDALSFGSECGNIDILTHAARTLISEPAVISEKIKDMLSKGASYASAREAAYSSVLDKQLLSSPNNILGIEYIKALIKNNSEIVPITHKRRGADYHDSSRLADIPSASAVREALKRNEDISSLTPFDFSNRTVYDTEKLSDIFRYCILTKRTEAFSGIADIEPGLDNRFLNAVRTAQGLDDIINSVKTKRYARTRLSRISMRALLGLSDKSPAPEYVRVLGFNATGRKVLAAAKKSCPLPIVNKVADFKSDALLPDILATDIASLAADAPTPFGRDYTTSPIIF